VKTRFHVLLFKWVNVCRYPEDVNLSPHEGSRGGHGESPHMGEDVRPPLHLFIVPKAPAQFIRARDGGAPIMLAPLWSRAAHEPSGLWTWPRGTEPLTGRIACSFA
jgi:hypothetical protein